MAINTYIDLRSDTITPPTPNMRKAMAEAEVGDDVFGEDPTVNRLEAMAAEMLGKEAALFVSSGTMGNLVSVLAHCGRGDEMILGDWAHIFRAEQGGAAALGGIHPHIVRTQPDGTLDLDDVAAAIRPDNQHYPITRLLCLENTHNYSGGSILPVDYMDRAGDFAHERGLKMHVDGARLWNASVGLNVSPARLVQNADSVSVCLSKGLAAPVGSIVAGDAEFIQKARRARKAVGGGMRQAGILAAAGIVSLTEMVERLADDHDNAQRLAQGLSKLDGIEVDLEKVQTNMVFFVLTKEEITPEQFVTGLRQQGVRLNASGTRRIRMVANYQFSSEDVEKVLAAFQHVLENGRTLETEKTYVYG
ncbi:low-specificity L-threonine aldolase [Chloroflexi bacterium TSY]|nr:low-specificity L-threonine aldolase [Chloroflexi bacterium TSY]